MAGRQRSHPELGFVAYSPWMYYASAKATTRASVTLPRPLTTLVTDRSSHRTTASTNCDTNFNSNQGCGTQAPCPDSYGKEFNDVGGGFYALARSKDYGIKVWFWSRAASSVPSDVQSNSETVDPNNWGIPTAFFPTGDNCGYEEYFNAHMLVFDLTFCVRWTSPCA